MNSGRKVPRNYECPIDTVLYDLSEKLDPIFHSLGFTANGITILSIVFEALSLRALAGRNPMFSLYNMIGYFFDCFDGYYARKHNQVSKLGDYMDHISDISYCIGFVIIVLMNFSRTEQLIILPVSAILFLLATTHLGCQEIVYGKPEESSTLGVIQSVCNKDNVHSMIPITRFFGTGVLAASLSIMVLIMTY